MFDRICSALELGELTATPVRLSGGYTHRMFRLDTATGCYAVKLLNPEIMQRPDALDNYRTAEHFESLLEAAELPILPAKVIRGRKMQCVDGQYLYVFDYFGGRVLQGSEITPAHCAKIGEVLARIHAVHSHGHSHTEDSSLAKATPQSDDADSSPAKATPQSADADSSPAKATPQSADADSSPAKGSQWLALAEGLLAAPESHAEGELLRSAVPMLTQVTVDAEAAVRRLPRMKALCHNDMDPKNVLWRGEDFRIIDLECLAYADPRQELLDLAVAWSAGEETCFKAFVSAYEAAGEARLADAALVYDSRRNYIDWLAYNARRALSADPEECRVAREQVRRTLDKVETDLANRETILRWLNEVWRT